MSGSVNKVILLGNISTDIEVRAMQNSSKVANFNLATNEYWKDKSTGERKERSQYHKIVVFNEGIIKLCENYLKKGSKVYIDGQLETRSWDDKDGKKCYVTEVVLRPYRGELTMLDSGKSDGQRKVTPEEQNDEMHAHANYLNRTQSLQDNPFGGQGLPDVSMDDLDDDIPFD